MIPQPSPAPVYPTACGGQIQDPARYVHAEYQGRTYYFCTPACLRAFERDPERFMRGEIPHPLEGEDPSGEG